MYKKHSPRRPPPHQKPDPEYPEAIAAAVLEGIFARSTDYETREVQLGLDAGIRLNVCWIDGLVSGDAISQNILRPLTDSGRAHSIQSQKQCVEELMGGLVYSYSVKKRDKLDDLVSDLTHGHCAVIFDELAVALTFEVRSDKSRSVSEPTLEKSLKGARDSFVETLRVNTALVRRRICTPKLKLMEARVGRKTDTRVAIMFIDGIVAPETVGELAHRLDKLDVEALVSSGTFEEYIVDAPRSPFPQLIHTERPDRFAKYLLEGRIGLLIDGLPVALVLPVTFAQFMRVSSDNSMHYLVATALTILRYFALLLGLLLPPLYVAVAMYHQEMIPVRLLLSIIDAKQNVPFSTSLEILSLLVALGFLQEAGLRLPNPIGDTVSIIGALIVGQSAVEAKLVSPIAIIVVALSGIACYTLPSQDLGSALRLTRFVMLIGAISAGLYGVGIATCLLLLHLASIDSFGVNYTAPLSDGRSGGLIRLLIRPPKPRDKFRDPLLNTPDRRRQK